MIIMARKRTNPRRHSVKRRRSTKRGRLTKRNRTRNVRRDKFSVTLQRLKKLKAKQRRQAIEVANAKFIRDFVSQVKKLRRTTKLRPDLRRKLKRHTKSLKKLINSRTGLDSKRQLMSQRGGFLPLLLAALPAVGSIVGGIISRT